MALVKIIRNNTAIKARVANGEKRMVSALTEQVVKDSNIFCRQDQGTLMSSALIASQPERGLAIWNTAYAKRVYYTGTPSTDVNPNASLMWVEKARSAYGDEWEKLAQKTFKEGMG